MQKKRKKISEKDVERWVKEWNTLQAKGTYKPWLELREVPSIGRSRKVKGIKTGHIHHFLSDLEYHIYLVLEFDPSVIAIYEQYPLLPRSDTIGIANAFGIRHPIYPRSKTPIVYTTDFVFDQKLSNGKIVRKAITAKYSSALNPEKKTIRRTLHLMELERLAHAKKGIELKCITEKCINENKIYNLKWFIQHASIDEELQSLSKGWLALFINCIKDSESSTLLALLKSVANEMGIPKEDSNRLYLHNMWHQRLKTDICKKINLTDIVGQCDYVVA